MVGIGEIRRLYKIRIESDVNLYNSGKALTYSSDSARLRRLIFFIVASDIMYPVFTSRYLLHKIRFVNLSLM